MLVLVALKTQPVSYSSLNFSLNSLNKTCLAHFLNKKKKERKTKRIKEKRTCSAQMLSSVFKLTLTQKSGAHMFVFSKW